MNLSFKLENEFVEAYKSKKEPFGYNGLGAVVFYRTYSRLKEDGTYESWAEVCERVINGMYSIQKDHCLSHNRAWSDDKAQKSAQEAFDRLFNLKWTPPGRGLWNMGSPTIHERGIVAALNNCFSATTEIITKELGPISLGELENQNINVWTEDGWKKATVRSFGKQTLYKITFAPAEKHDNCIRKLRSNIRIEHQATKNHRWILHDNTETTSIKVGDAILSQAVSTNKESSEYQFGYIHGLIFGDGTKAHHRYSNGDYLFELRACDEKMKLAAGGVYNFFDTIYLERESSDGDPHYVLRTKIDMKDFPHTSSPEYISGFIDGWITADGSTAASGNTILASQNPNAASWLNKWAALGGYIVSGISYDNRETNFGPRKNPLAKFTLKNKDNALWVVTNIEQLDEDIVYCPTVADIGRFTLASGIYTGNCAFASTKNLAKERGYIFEWFTEMLMLGVGVGFDTDGAHSLYINKPKSPAIKYVIEDSREGWAKSVALLFESYVDNHMGETSYIVEFDYSKIRPAGEPIKGFGGTSSGPEPLIKLHERMRKILDANVGEPITVTTITDIFNCIGACVVAGNVRRSSEIALGDANDDEFLNLKNYKANPERAEWGWASNNSIKAYPGKTRYDKIAKLIHTNGEPGIVWMDNVQKHARMNNHLATGDENALGFNPCGEQPLEHMEMCTLTELYPSRHENVYDFMRSVKFAYLYAKTVTLLSEHISHDTTRKVMTKNRRIGLSITGITEFVAKWGIGSLIDLCEQSYKHVEHYDLTYSTWLGINQSNRKTSVKPSGSVSLLAGVTPGVHFPRSEYYIRRVRISDLSPMVKVLQNAGFHTEKDVYSDNTTVVEFPVHAGENVKSVLNTSIWEQLAIAAIMQKHWADNSVSVTISFDPKKVSPQEIETALDIYQFQLKSVSMLPEPEGGAYAQMPYEEITKEQYQEMLSKLDLNILGYLGLAMSVESKLDDKFCTTDTCSIQLESPNISH